MPTREEILVIRRAKYHALSPEQKKERIRKHLIWYHRTKAQRKEKLRAYDKTSYWRHREKHQAKAKRWAKKNPEKARIHNIRKNLKGFGLTIADYESLLLKQSGVCAICRMLCKSGRRLAVDHCHKTGAVRGLLCGSCNHGLGRFNDSPERLRAAANYLSEHIAKQTIKP
jgi:Recombination endonuclease VII